MKNWVTKKLGEVCVKITDGSHNPPKGVMSSDFIMLSSKNIFDDLIHYEEPRYLTQKDFENENKRTEVKNNDVLLTIVGTIGRVAVVPSNHPKFALQRSVAVLKTKENILDSRFLMFSLQNILKFLTDEARGVAQKGIYLNQLRDIEIPLPPLSEQQRIVSILDDAFAKIGKAKANAEQNLKNAKELFESYLQGVLENGNWEEKTLGQLSKNKDAVVSGPFGSNLKVSDYKTEGIPILRLQNIGKGYFINKSIKYITKQKAEELKYHSFVNGDIALAKLGIPIGKTCIIPENFKSGIITADIVRIRPDSNVVNYKFLENFLNTTLAVSQLTSNISGATRPRVNLSDVRNIVIKLPSLKEQQTIVQKLDALNAETKKLEAVYQQKIKDLEELKKSVLQKAFSGELKYKKEQIA
jgi:type I restriction enzyme S subunit